MSTPINHRNNVLMLASFPLKKNILPMKNAKLDNNIPFNELPILPPDQTKIETIAILRKVTLASIALSELKGLAYTLPNPAILLNAVILKEAQMSSEIENVITTHDKLYQALSATGTSVDHATKEVLRYREAMLAGFHMVLQKGFLNTNGIVSIQEILEENKAGLRKLPVTSLKNAITGEVIYTPPDDYDTILLLMKNLEVYMNETDVISPLIKLAVQHYQFESIHPFYDGNGRTGRIINVLYLCLHDLLDSPVLYLSDYIIKHKTDYYRLLGEVKMNGNWEGWVLFILSAVEDTARQTNNQIKSINRLFLKLQDKIKENAPKLYNKELLELLFEQPYCKIEFLVDRLNVSRVTASKYLSGLEKIGILQSKKIWKEIIYINIELFELLKK